MAVLFGHVATTAEDGPGAPGSGPSGPSPRELFRSQARARGPAAERLDERLKVKLGHVDHKRSSGHSVSEEAIGQLRHAAQFVIAGVGD